MEKTQKKYQQFLIRWHLSLLMLIMSKKKFIDTYYDILLHCSLKIPVPNSHYINHKTEVSYRFSEIQNPSTNYPSPMKVKSIALTELFSNQKMLPHQVFCVAAKCLIKVFYIVQYIAFGSLERTRSFHF